MKPNDCDGKYPIFSPKMDMTKHVFRQGAGKKKKYNMVKWDGLCLPKEFGGLDFLDTRAMNTALLARLYRVESGDDSLRIRLKEKNIWR